MAQGSPERPFSEVLKIRRATPHFESTPIPDTDLKRILCAGMEAPSGYNLQPWRFVVVRDPEHRKKLRAAAMNQPKVEEAPVVIVACGDPEGWSKGDMEMAIRMGNERGFPESGNDMMRGNISGLLGGKGGSAAGIDQDMRIWLNRHVMIAFTTMMWMAEVLGYDTAPMEGFFEDKVKETLGIPQSVKVIALLAVGHRKGNDKPYGGRFETSHTVFGEKWGNPLNVE